MQSWCVLQNEDRPSAILCDAFEGSWGGRMDHRVAETGFIVGGVGDTFQFTGFIDESEHAFYISKYISGLDFEATIGSFVAICVGAIVVYFVNLTNNWNSSTFFS